MFFKFFFLIFFLPIVLVSKEKVVIGRDPAWQDVDLGDRLHQVNAFLNELFEEIGAKEKIDFTLQETSHDTLFCGLEEGGFQGVVSAITPTEITKEKYDFSAPFLFLGPVLVVSQDSTARSLKDLTGKKVGIAAYDNTVLLVQKIPSILIENYQNLCHALLDLENGKIDGVLLNNLQAQAIVPQRFPYTLKIATPPLTDASIRLVTLKSREKKLIMHFNQGLKKIRQSGMYNWLRVQYSVN